MEHLKKCDESGSKTTGDYSVIDFQFFLLCIAKKGTSWTKEMLYKAGKATP